MFKLCGGSVCKEPMANVAWRFSPGPREGLRCSSSFSSKNHFGEALFIIVSPRVLKNNQTTFMLHNECFLGIQKYLGRQKKKTTGHRLPFPFATNCLGVPDINGGKPPKACQRPTGNFRVNHGSFTPMKPLVVTFIRTQQDNAGHHSPFTYHISMEQKYLMIPRQFPPIIGNRFQFSIQPTNRNTTCAIFLGR